MGKGKQTKQQILAKGLALASETGLNDLTIGMLATASGMSKSGLFGHFNSKETMQLNVLEYASDLFKEHVILACDKDSRGLAKLNQLCQNWLNWYKPDAATCIFINAAAEFDDQPGALREHIQATLKNWLSYLQHIVSQAIQDGDFNSDTCPKQFVFELYSLYLGSQNLRWLSFEDDERSRFQTGFNALLDKYGAKTHEQ
ncbi:TetR/AcrR family transcriptional regulator [Pseudoalteromonas luteoviolacea]|uniref:TetR/AcrR family transcriptional regulator n=1 Tax=Pseudoalteromonas luteoviolacea TaxID=43657 RepID=UPI001F300E90|nr:TetR/AcrR family transcriptional regulator [Pseudoalteromonas luteoviolacea]MCF6439831.1 TetR/AcrR family transcriptional regulator [Pseudoalteromonas luteoviolacea]